MGQSQIVLVAAGTGGHINAAKSIGAKFLQKNFDVLYFTGRRDLDLRLFQNENTIFLKSESLRNRTLLKKILSFFNNLIAFFQSFNELSKSRPKVVIGAGGYICGPVLVAAFILGIPIYILEQNSVMGLTNKLLAFLAKKIFLNFEKTKGMELYKAKLSLVGNPINEAVRSHRYSFVKDEQTKILVVGGSLGAQEINNLFRKFIAREAKLPLWVRHQTGLNKGFEVEDANVRYEQLDYIDDMAREYDWADLIVCRAGASTLSEIRFVQKPVILIPYPHATDNHQKTNAQLFKEESHFPVYIHTTLELEDSDFSLFCTIIRNNQLDTELERVDLSTTESTQERIYRECQNDF